jgi:hypothetical protein
MSKLKKSLSKLSNSFHGFADGNEANLDVEENVSETSATKQYTVTRQCRKESWFHSLLRTINPDEYQYSPWAPFVLYINWTFKASFLTVFLSFLAIFMFLIFTFGGFIKLAGDARPECIISAGEEFGYNPSTKLADGFQLSWTTFTTVGYGAVYTATGTNHDQQGQCSFIVFLCTVESFLGLLYAGMCAAILFSKVGRVQSHAQVEFSAAVCIVYGKRGNNIVSAPNTPSASKDSPLKEPEQAIQNRPQDSEQSIGSLTCPVLKFQLVNQLANTPGGEILDAVLMAVARKESSHIQDEAVARFTNIKLEEMRHPYFNRVWHGRHLLNHESPLLSADTREVLRLNGGYWPEEWHSPQGYRDRIRFNDLLITLTGISNVSAASVHATKRYQLSDVLMGFDFAPIMYKTQGSSHVSVDMKLINDVIEQETGDSEYIDDTNPSIRLQSTILQNNTP